MQVVEVAPVVRGITHTSLTYFTKDHFEPGTFVQVPLRKNSALGIVLSSKDAHLSKAELKQSNFALRKLAQVKRAGKLSTSFMQAVAKTAEYYATTSGSVLGVVLSKTFLNESELLKQKTFGDKKKYNPIVPIQLLETERFREYKSIIRENLAKSHSLLFIVPTQTELEKAYRELRIGIEDYVFRGNKELKEALEEKHAIVFISTPSEVAFSRRDLSTIIVEHESSNAYRTRGRPYINYLTFIKFLTQEQGLSLVLGDCPLSLETLSSLTSETGEEYLNLSWKLDFASEAQIIDMRGRLFEPLSKELNQEVKQTLNIEGKVFLFGVRKGLAPSTVCGDCGSLLLCDNCGAPLVLHKSKTGERIYRCHHCSAVRSAETKCDTCGSWKLRPLGIGSDSIYSEVERLFPGVPIFLLDRDHVTTRAQAKTIIKEFETNGGILVGTEFALSYLNQVDLVGVVSLDSLFSIPDFSINEKIFSLLTRMRQIASRTFLLQTRNAGQEIIGSSLKGDILNYYRTESLERKDLFYPPFSLFVRVSLPGEKKSFESIATELQNMFLEFEPRFTIERGAELNMLIRVPRESWPDSKLIEKLLLLSPEFLIKVDPESLK